MSGCDIRIHAVGRDVIVMCETCEDEIASSMGVIRLSEVERCVALHKRPADSAAEPTRERQPRPGRCRMNVDHCGTGNTASPRCSPERRDGTVARWTVTWSCMDCGAVLAVVPAERPFVTSRPGYAGDGSDPDRGADWHLSRPLSIERVR